MDYKNKNKIKINYLPLLIRKIIHKYNKQEEMMLSEEIEYEKSLEFCTFNILLIKPLNFN